jgi:hypothetical protein
MAANPERVGGVVTNAEFLAHVLGPLSPTENAWVCTFAVPPAHAGSMDWAGRSVSRFEQVHDFKVNAYFSVSILKGRRRGADFSRMACVVLDDAPYDPGASWTLETSPGKSQVGYIIRPHITDEGIASRLQKELSQQGLVKADTSGYSSVRYVRLPAGCNTKTSPPHPHALIDWQPECVFTIDDLIEKFQLDADFIKRPSVPQGTVPLENQRDDRRFSGDDSEYVRNIVTGDMYHDSLLALSARYIARGIEPHAVAETMRGFMLARTQHDERWQARYDEIPRMVRGAAEKFTPSDPGAATQAEGGILKEYVRRPPRPIPTLVRGYLPLDGVGMLWAPPGGFKSFLAIDWALSVATGREWFGNPVKKGRVWYIAGEGHQGLDLRISAWCQARRHEGSIDGLLVSERALTLDAEDGMPSAHALALIEKAKEQPPALIIIDTLSRSMVGDESATKDSARYIAALDAVLHAVRTTSQAVCILLVHHSRKDESVYRGSSVLRGAVDFECRLEREQGSFVARLEFQKAKDGALPGPMTFRASAELLGDAADNHGQMVTMTSLVLWTEAPVRGADPVTAKAQALMPALSRVLGKYPEGLSMRQIRGMARLEGGKFGNGELDGLLEELARTGAITRNAQGRSVIWALP